MKFNADTIKERFDDLKSNLSDLSFSGYPMDYQRVDQKTIPVIERLNVFEGKTVLEMGSNFGMYSLLLSSIAKDVHAVEIDEHLHGVSLRWKEFFADAQNTFSNVHFSNEGALEIGKYNYNALLLTLVLYHLNNEEIDFLLEEARNKCDTILIQCRPARILAKEKGAFRGHVSKNTRFDGLCDIAANVRFLREVGMKEISIYVSEDLLGEEAFPVLIGKR